MSSNNSYCLLLEDKNTKLQTENAILREKNAILTNICKEYTSTNQLLTWSHELHVYDYQHSIKDLQHDVQDLKNSNVELNTNYNLLKNQLFNYKNQNELLQHEKSLNKHLYKSLNQSKTEINELKCEINIMKQELNTFIMTEIQQRESLIAKQQALQKQCEYFEKQLHGRSATPLKMSIFDFTDANRRSESCVLNSPSSCINELAILDTQSLDDIWSGSSLLSPNNKRYILTNTVNTVMTRNTKDLLTVYGYFHSHYASNNYT
eukprot:399807_1